MIPPEILKINSLEILQTINLLIDVSTPEKGSLAGPKRQRWQENEVKTMR